MKIKKYFSLLTSAVLACGMVMSCPAAYAETDPAFSDTSIGQYAEDSSAELAKPVVEAYIDSTDSLYVLIHLVEGADRYAVEARATDGHSINRNTLTISIYENIYGYVYKPVSGDIAVLYFPYGNYPIYMDSEVQVLAANSTTKVLGDVIIPSRLTESEENVLNFVDRLYKILLDRPADLEGLWDWSLKLQNGQATTAEIIHGIAASPEFKNKNLSNDEIVEKMYKSMMGRESDASGKEYWVSRLDTGMTVDAVINGFLGSPEFGAICSDYGITPGSISNLAQRDKNFGVTSFVARCYLEALDRSSDEAGLEDWTGRINRKEETPQEIAYGFVFSTEMANRDLSNEQFVDMLYSLCFGRTPDVDGKTDWLTKLKNGTSREKVFYGFADSVEFNNLVSSFGL